MKTIEKKDPYLNILNTEGNIYEEFLPDQVLTHKNLNKVVNYFEDQDRLSRIYLIGVGIGCGMDIVSYSDGEIIIAQGAGITTDGDIIKTETRTFQYYTELTDKAAYALFEGRKIYEMYEQEGAGLGPSTDEHPLTSFNTNETGTLKDYMVIAYVENYTEDEGLCGGSGCDETGNKVYSNIKFLLTHKNNYNHLISGDTIYRSHDVLSYYDTLPEVCMPRILLTKTNTTSGISIHDQFKNSFVLKTDLFIGITKIIDSFKHRINFARYGVNISQITTYFDTIFNVQQEQFIQYKYDLLKDLVDTYREIRELVLHTRFECVPNVNAFPKHLLLGTLEEQTRLNKRHSFYPSPTVSKNDKNLLSIRALCIKFFNQLKEYKIPNVATAAIKITPSKSYEFKLSERSIPYYYETKNALITNWNPISIQQRKPKNQLGYHVSNLKNIPCIQQPLKYSHLDKDFYRIEGHIGKDFRLALKRINNLKAANNLAFDVKAISIGFPVNKITLDDDICDTKDYAILLKTWEQEFNCTAESATEFFQKYQFDALGNNDTSTSVYTLATTQQQQALQLLRKQQPESTNPDKIESKTINTNASAENTPVVARYESSIQYAIDQAYINAGTQNVSASYISVVALGIIDQTLGTVDRDSDYFFYTESAVKIVAGLRDIRINFLQSLDEIYNTEKWTALNNAIDQLCTDIDQVLFAISEAGDGSTFGSQTHDKMYEYFIYDLSKICCLKGKFSWLKEQIDAIRYDIYRELVLSRLIEAHPGIEHMAGVPKGGTFLMVYLGGTESALDDTGTVERQFNGVVQFDFALPYMCCSDCPPETVVYNNAEAETTLVIAKTKYCLPGDDGQVDFIIQPSNGVVTSPQGDAFIVETDSGYAFDPSGVPDDLLGQTIMFVVNGKLPTVPVEICVYKFPTDIVTSATSPSWDASGVTLNLSVNHENLTAYPYAFTYTWLRADGSEIGTGNDVTAVFSHAETLNNPTFTETITVAIGIAGTPTACTVEAELPISETRPIDNDIEVAEINCYKLIETSPALIPVTVTPFGAALISPEDADPSFIEENDAGDYFINPIKVPVSMAGTEITFAVNNEPILGKSTRIGMLPAFINRDEENNAIDPFQVISWDENGVTVNIRAAHQFQDKTYIQYNWINTADGSSIGNTRLVSNVFIPGTADAIANFRVEMNVAGIEDLCMTSFNVDFIIPRPSLDIATGICFGESIELNVESRDAVTTSLGYNVIEEISGTITFESGLLQNDDVGQPFNIFVNGASTTTTVYKVPSSENIGANSNYLGWDGDNVIVDLVTNPRVPGVTGEEDYLEVKWFDNEGVLIPNENLADYAVPSDGGVVDTTFSVTVCVKSELGVVTTCESSIDVPIRHTRPTFDLERGYCCGDGIILDDIIIAINPAEVRITSPEGTAYLETSSDGNTYLFKPSLVPNTLIGQLLTFEVEGTEVASTRVYKVPAIEGDYARPINWEGNTLVTVLTTSYDLPDVISPENYLNIEWKNGAGATISNPDNHRITSVSGTVNETYSVTASVKPELMDTDPCETPSVPVLINQVRPEPEPTVPTDLGLEDRYCWKEGEPTLNIPIPVHPNDFIITSPQGGTGLIRPNTASHTFVVTNAPNSGLGNPIQFQIDGNTIDTTTVFKLPLESSILHDQPNSQWSLEAYEFAILHNLDQHNYFSYNVSFSDTGETVEEVRPGIFKVSAGNAINTKFRVEISVNGVACTSIAPEVTVADTRDSGEPTTTLTRLNCQTPYSTRMNDLNLSTILTSFSDNIRGQRFENDIRTIILSELNITITDLNRASNINTEAQRAIPAINRYRNN